MEVLDAEQVRGLLDPAALVDALREAFAADAVRVPDRTHVTLDPAAHATLLLKPAWQPGGWLGVKVLTHHPGNGDAGLPAIHATYLLSRADTGEPVAVLDGTELTRWRTAAASALAADVLAPPTVDVHLLVGAGNVAAAMPACYRTVRDVGLTLVWARSSAKAAALVSRLRAEGFEAEAADDLRAAVRRADVVTTATSSTRPLVLAEDVRPGTHVDLVGAFTPGMVEADEALVTSASLFVDVPAALHEPGDLVGPLSRGTLRPGDVLATLTDLAAGRHPGRTTEREITVFKSVGTALEDLVAAALAWDRHRSAAAER
ncbi:ornithine cyclodeaminase family protein [Ornithinimicrobium tianjinense]|uniref:Ornithine cyclodeaminase n=1 Tax=Ornithinimicrobium tianjinense TaxID=1195761 RepID=A0A917BJJ6_9MICO|nr:ornithine cyclodeaminase family protein [Ornithinimicrobium tianjinense]GGF45712.1 ornithine cyclodeaminase [Ornithinimicrobium tianjinense]